MYPQIHQKIFNEPWLIHESAYDSIRETFLARIGQTYTADFDQSRIYEPPPARGIFAESESSDSRKPFLQRGPVAIVPFHGVVGKMISFMESLCGGCDIDAVMASIEAAYADPSVDTVVIHAHTPGGTVTGIPEASARIAAMAAEGNKEIITFTETLNASAGYYVTAPAHRIVSTPSARSGSIGVVMTLVDQSAHDAKLGVKYTTIKTGELKDLGNPHRAATADELDILENEAFDIAADFFQAVATARDLSPEYIASLEAGVFRGEEAKARLLVDQTVSSLDELLATL